MRVNPDFSSEVLIAIGRNQQASATALQQMSSGKRVNVPSDDPAAAAAMVQLSSHADQIDQYSANITQLLNMMHAADSALSAVTTELDQAIAAGVQGANGTLSDVNREILAEKVTDILSNVISHANLSYMGVYLFAGTESTIEPFVPDSSAPSGYLYRGNSNSNSVPIGDGLNLQVSVPGDRVFQESGADVIGSLRQLITALQGGNTTAVGDATTSIRQALERISQQRVFFGNNMTQLTNQQTYLQKQAIDLKSQQDSLLAADLAQVAIEFTQAQTQHSATLAAAARLVQNSLLDYLK